MNTRAQHGIPALIVLALALVVCYLSFTREPADSFLFPRLVSSVMLVLSIWNFIRAIRGVSKVGTGISFGLIKTILPGLIVGGVYVFIAAKALGFYLASLITFFILFSLYDPNPHTSVRSWVTRALVSIIFMAVIYGLFTLLLKVQTPRGIFM